MTDELKLCAHCGDSAQCGQLGAFWTVECTACNIRTADRRDASQALAEWNDRAPSPEVTALVKAARALTAKLDLLSDEISGAFFMAYTRMGVEYKGENYGEDLEMLRDALAPFEAKP